MGSSGIGPIERRTLHEDLADQLRHAIVHGELRPGAKISEKILTEQFGVSRTPVREALKILSTEGLVELKPNRGASVTRLTWADLRDTFPVMGVLEALAGELACENATSQQIERMRTLYVRMVAMFEKGDRKGYFRVNEDIHQLILDASGNAALPRMQRTASAQVRRARYMANLSSERWAQAIAEHGEILAAFEKRDGARMGGLLKTHLANKLKALEKAFREREAAEA